MSVLSSAMPQPSRSGEQKNTSLLEFDFMRRLFVEPEDASSLEIQRGVLFVRRFADNIKLLVDPNRVGFGPAGYQRIKIFLAEIGYHPKAYVNSLGVEGDFRGNDYASAERICDLYEAAVSRDKYAHIQPNSESIKLDNALFPYFIAIAIAAERPDVAILLLSRNAERMQLDFVGYFKRACASIFALNMLDAIEHTVTDGANGHGTARFLTVMRDQANKELFEFPE